MISLIPCYSLEDFSLYRKASDVDEIFSAWSALYHPALVAHFNDAPRWEAAGSPSSGQKRRLVVVPPCAEYMLSRKWIKEAEENGAVVIRHVSDRDDILKEAFQRLNIDPHPQTENTGDNDDDHADSFLAVGLCCFMEELLTRKLRYMSNLDQVSFNSRIVEAARAHMRGDSQEREKGLQKAFDLLTQSKEYFFPTATKFLNLVWTQEEDLESALPNMLKGRRKRQEKTNLVLPVPVLKSCVRSYPETLALLREEIQAKRIELVGGDEWEAPLYLLAPTEIIDALRAGQSYYLSTLGIVPTVFGRNEAGYAQILPQYLRGVGYKGALSRTGDGWSLLEKRTDRSQIQWLGRDGSSIATLCKSPLDASNSEEIVQMPERIGNTYYSDDSSAVVFEHRPGKETRWLRDLLRMDRYSPTLGKFYSLSDYLRVTEGSGDKEKFVKDVFKTNFLTRSAKRSRKNLVSLWPIRRRLSLAASGIQAFETLLRSIVYKAKISNSSVEATKSELIDQISSLAQRATSLRQNLDAQLFSTNEKEEHTTNVFVEVEKLELNYRELIQTSGNFLRALSDEIPAPTLEPGEDAAWKGRGFLLVNSSATSHDVLWETRFLSEQKTEELETRLNGLVQSMRSRLEKLLPNASLRVFTVRDVNLRRFVLSLPPYAYFWVPQMEGLEYNFITRPFFLPSDSESPLWPTTPPPPKTLVEQEKKKTGFFKTLVFKVRDGSANDAKSEDPNQVSHAETQAFLAEYVEERLSATHVDRFYRLRNEYVELKIDAATGIVKRLQTSNANSSLVGGVLHQPTLGNRFAWDVALKLPDRLLSEDHRSREDSSYGYTTSAADDISILSATGGVGVLRVCGRLVAPNGELAATFTEIITLRRHSRVIEVDLEIAAQIEPDSSPWNSYYACRFAWKDALAQLSGGVSATLIGTTRDYFQAPEAVDIRSEAGIGITILSAGLPYFRKTGSTRMDAVLAPKGEEGRRFHFAIGVDLEDPQLKALSYADAQPIVLADTPALRRPARQLFSVDADNIMIVSAVPVANSTQAQPNFQRRAERVNDDFNGVRLTLLETHSAATTARLKCALPIERIHTLAFDQTPNDEKVDQKSSIAVELDFRPRQMRILEVFFERP